MKQIIFSGVGVSVIVLVILVILTLQGTKIRATRLNNGVTELMEEYMEESYRDLTLKNFSDSEFTDWFLQNLSERISEDAEFLVIIKKRNMDAGILSLKVKESYSHIIGTKGSLSVENTVLYEEEEPVSLQNISFCFTEEMAKELGRPSLLAKYCFPVGTKIPKVNPPIITGKRFLYWKELGSNQICDEEELDNLKIGFEEQTYIAVYE